MGEHTVQIKTKDNQNDNEFEVPDEDHTVNHIEKSVERASMMSTDVAKKH